nr:hypothetical protein BaRGS_006443 [Batillaria attramentaria]
MISGGDSAGDDDVFKEIEKPLFESVQDDKAADGVAEVAMDDSGSDSDSSSDYDQLEEDQPPKPAPPQSRRSVPLPPSFGRSKCPEHFLYGNHDKVLAVMTAEDVKEYKIFTDVFLHWQNGQVTLDKKSFFRTVDDLLENYSHSPLPNRTQTLGRAYSSHQI